MKPVRTLHNIPLFEEREIAPGLFLAVSGDGTRRVHNGKIFLGYAHALWANSRGEPRCLVYCERGDRPPLRRASYKTIEGATHALVCAAIASYRAEA